MKTKIQPDNFAEWQQKTQLNLMKAKKPQLKLNKNEYSTEEFCRKITL